MANNKSNDGNGTDLGALLKRSGVDLSKLNMAGGTFKVEERTEEGELKKISSYDKLDNALSAYVEKVKGLMQEKSGYTGPRLAVSNTESKSKDDPRSH